MNKISIVFGMLLLLACHRENSPKTTPLQAESPAIVLPGLVVNNDQSHPIAKAYRIAVGDLMSNVQLLQSENPEDQKFVLFAGLAYNEPWTRDAAINTWNGFGLLSPEIAKNTLLSQISKDGNGNEEIAGQYWDKIIWTLGAWQYYLYSGDSIFLKRAYVVSKKTMENLEIDEFSNEIQLFRGPAVYGDGVAAYPDRYTRAEDPAKTDSFYQVAAYPDRYVPAERPAKSGTYSGIFEWVALNPATKHPTGFGIPMHALSTNAVYYEAYKILDRMQSALQLDADSTWSIKANRLKEAINRAFWDSENNRYRYLVDPFGGCDYQESLGISFCLLFGIADSAQSDVIFKNMYVSPQGIPCLYPSFPRYRNEKEQSYGRHCGTVWPHIQGFWADAAMKAGRIQAFSHEFNALTKHAIRDCQFVEIYHPETGLPYGGLQEPYLKEKTIWFVSERQSWSASAYLRMVYMDLLGMQFEEKGIRFSPALPDGINEIGLKGLKYRNAIVTIHVKGEGCKIKNYSLNGISQEIPILPSSTTGNAEIEILLEK